MTKRIVVVALTPLIIWAALVFCPPNFHILPCISAPAHVFEAARVTILAKNILPMVAACGVCAALMLRVSCWFLPPSAFAAILAYGAYADYREATPCINSLENAIADGPGWAALGFATVLSVGAGWLIDLIGRHIHSRTPQAD
jgi:hypothetical protein